MKSTLYLKFIFIYIVFGFLSLFTAATLTENLVSTPIFNRVSNSMYREATMVANDYLPGYFLHSPGTTRPRLIPLKISTRRNPEAIVHRLVIITDILTMM